MDVYSSKSHLITRNESSRVQTRFWEVVWSCSLECFPGAFIQHGIQVRNKEEREKAKRYCILFPNLDFCDSWGSVAELILMHLQSSLRLFPRVAVPRFQWQHAIVKGDPRQAKSGRFPIYSSNILMQGASVVPLSQTVSHSLTKYK